MSDNIVKFKRKLTQREKIRNLKRLQDQMLKDLEVVFHVQDPVVINIFVNNWIESLDSEAKIPNINWKFYKENFNWSDFS